MKNAEVGRIFNEIADFLEIKGDNPFRIRAYRKAAANIEAAPEPIEDIARKNALDGIPGIGADLAEKINEILTTGKVKTHEQLKKEIPETVLEFMQIPYVGPKTAKLIYDSLKVKSIGELEKKARQGKLIGLPGIQEKTVENILKGIEIVKKGKERMPLGKALPLAEEIIGALKKLPEVKKINYAGSLRRMKETVRDIDILITSTHPEKVMRVFITLPVAADVIAHGPTKSSIRTKDGVNIDLRVVEPNSFGAALLYFTGSKAHNIRIRTMANKLGLKISEYGVFKEKTNKKIAGKQEQDVYKALRLPYIPPEIREDQGEIEAALHNKLPRLLDLSDIKGDFHVHSNYSDGNNTIAQMAQAAKNKGYKFIAICDHTKSLSVAGGLSEREALKQIGAIRKLNKKLKGIFILAGTELEILADGKLDFKDDLLKEFDFVVAAVHSRFKMQKDEMTDRILKAMDNRYVNCIAHLTGRLLGARDPYDVDLEKLLEAAKQTNTFLEINAFPQRLDLTDTACRMAKERGAGVLISTDSHATEHLDFMKYGVAVARRGWLEKQDVLNTYSRENIIKILHKKR
ncbi:MAG: DNA polymerase/3'-5' exonuclease PolX [Candidatus Omnitrophota bacterium]